MRPPGDLEHALLVLDLDLVATVDLAHNVVMVAGQLTPQSFILSHSCRLTGGFALVFYLPGSPHASDVAFTVGGYHPRYKPPAHYPSAPPRVGISWKYDDDLHICGETYFAITPQAVMGGGRLDMVLDKGWVRASFSAYADFFMNFHPFYFEAEVGVSIYASVSIGKGWFSIHLGPLEFTASLSLHGPPYRRHCSSAPMDVQRHRVLRARSRAACGAGVDRLPPSGQEPAGGRGREEDNELYVYHHAGRDHARLGGCRSHARAGVSNVRAAQFKFQVETRVPVMAAVIGAAGKSAIGADEAGNPWTPQVYAAPMQLDSPFGGSDLSILLKRESTDELVPLKGTPVFKKLPPALWGVCKCSIPSSVHSPGANVMVR